MVDFDSDYFILLQLFYMFFALLPSQESDSYADRALWEKPYEILNSLMYCFVHFTEIYTITCISTAVIEEDEKLSTYIHKSVFINADKRFIQSVSCEICS